jgi:hypothetical protein
MRRFLIVVAAILFCAGHAFGKPTAAPLSLEQMARNKFPEPPLTAAEERVVRAAPDGTVADCWLGGGSDPAKADGTPEAPDEKWPDTRNVRAGLIRWLFVDREARKQVDPRGVQIRDARITGALDLSFSNARFPLFLLSCRLDQPLNLQWAKMPLLSLEGSWTGAIAADQLKLEGSLFLRDGFHAEGKVGLLGATIGGDLSAEGGTFKNSNGIALSADSAKIGGNLFMKQELDAEGRVQNAFTAEGEVRLPDATIGSNLEATGGTFKNLKPDKNPNSTGNALNTDRIKVSGSVLLGDGFSAEGEVLLRNATIGGDLVADDGTFKNLKSDKNPNPTGRALSADRAEVSGSVLLRDKFLADGEVRLLGATIGGNLEATGGTFKNQNGNALIADRIEVGGNVFLNDKFLAEGMVRLPDAEIKGQLAVVDAWLDELNLQSAHVAGPFLWQHIEIRAWWIGSHLLDLNGANVGALADEEASWPRKRGLILDGFVYDRIAEGPTDAKTRLRWLGLQDGYRPQPYEQLIAVLRQMGHEDQVAEVAIAKQKDLYAHGGLGWWGKVKSWVLYLAVDYGYHAWLAFVWMAALVIVGTLMFRSAHSVGVMVPSDKEAYDSDEKTEKALLPHYCPKFNALVYSLDVIFPFDLGQKSHWRLSEKQSGAAVYWIYEGYSLVQLIFGWALLLIAAAATTGLIK